MRILGIDHVAIIGESIDGMAQPYLDLLAMLSGPREFVEGQRTDAAFLLTEEEAGACVELIAPRGNPTLEKFLEKRGPGLHHVAFRVEDVDVALRELDERGVKLIDKVGRPGARGHRVGFIHPATFGGVLVELVGH